MFYKTIVVMQYRIEYTKLKRQQICLILKYNTIKRSFL